MPQSLADIKEMLAARALAPRHALGQNFLIDHNLIRKLIDAAAPAPGDLILEVGPGTGTLTETLLERGCTVIACELDRGLAALLRDRFASHLADRSLTLIEGDCLERKSAISPDILNAIDNRPFRLIANLPYAAASPLMVTLAADHTNCRGQFVTIQREVAQRLRAQPNTRDYSELSVVVQAMCDIRRIATLPPECFWPRPKVTSEMIAITPREQPLTDNPAQLASLCHALFTQRRKQIGAILGREFPFPPDITPTARPEALTIEQLVALSRLRQM